MKLTARPDFTSYPESVAADRHLLISLEAPSADPGSAKAPVEIAFVIDRSGSMAGGRLELAKAALKRALGSLRPTDTFAIVAYDSTVEVVAAAALASAKNKREALDRLAEVAPRSMTNLGAGWLTGAGMLKAASGLSRVLLLTDGLVNEGETSPDALATHAIELRKRGVSLSTFGVGHDFDEGLLSALATAGGGNFYYISEAAQIPDFIASELGEALDVVVGGAVLTILHDDDVTVEPLSMVAAEVVDPGQTRLHLGSLVADQALDLVVRLHLAPSVAPRAVTVSGSCASGAFGGQDQVVFSPLPAADAAAATPDPEVIREVAKVDIAKVTFAALVANRAGDYGAASGMFLRAARSYDAYADGDAVLGATLASAHTASMTYSAPLSESALKGLHWDASNTARGRVGTMGQARKKADPQPKQ